MKNLACREPTPTELGEINAQCRIELVEAGIHVIDIPRVRSEVPYQVIGLLGGWWFTRAWTYWVARPADSCRIVLPFDYANPLHEAHGQVVRVSGHCGCPSPEEWYKRERGFLGVDLYHIDTQEGLNALAATLRKWMEEVATDCPYDNELETWRHMMAPDREFNLLKSVLNMEPEEETCEESSTSPATPAEASSPGDASGAPSPT